MGYFNSHIIISSVIHVLAQEAGILEQKVLPVSSPGRPWWRDQSPDSGEQAAFHSRNASVGMDRKSGWHYLEWISI